MTFSILKTLTKLLKFMQNLMNRINFDQNFEAPSIIQNQLHQKDIIQPISIIGQCKTYKLTQCIALQWISDLTDLSMTVSMVWPTLVKLQTFLFFVISFKLSVNFVNSVQVSSYLQWFCGILYSFLCLCFCAFIYTNDHNHHKIIIIIFIIIIIIIVIIIITMVLCLCWLVG